MIFPRTAVPRFAGEEPVGPEPTEMVRESAMRFLRVHPLPAADALQLAAAFIAAERRPASLQLVTLDERVAVAARKEGFALVDVV